jgi:hypothetical protein
MPYRLPVVDGSGRHIGHTFISYVREDTRHVDALQEVLETAGITVWRDTADLWPGHDWRTEIRRAIREDALVFIACFSRASLARHKSYQNEELVLAIEELRQRRPDAPWFIPVRFDDCKISDLEIGGGRTLASLQSADLFGDRCRQNSQRLIHMIQQILEIYPTTPADGLSLKDGPAYRDFYAPEPGRPWIRRPLVFSTLSVFVAAFLSVGAWQLIAANDGGPSTSPAPSRQAALRTQMEWAKDVNAECRLIEPTLDADVKAVTGLPPSAFERVPIDSRIPKALQRLKADESEITHLFQQDFPPPSKPSATVGQWLSALSDRDVTLSKATLYAQKISTDSSLLSYGERIPTAYYFDKFVSQTNNLRPLAAQLGIPNCV